MRTRVKICGFTNVEQAVYAAHLGVDAIGLVFYPPSPRNVSIKQAIEIVTALPAFTTVVALFVDETEAKIRNVLNQVSIDCIQFHGDENPDACRLYGKSYIKAVAMHDNTNIRQLSADYHDASALLLDAYHPQAKGGTGKQFDWDLIPQYSKLPIILAGGLNPKNAKHAVTTVRPYALDVSSGVEVSKGIKKAAKMATFIKEVNSGNQ